MKRVVIALLCLILAFSPGVFAIQGKSGEKKAEKAAGKAAAKGAEKSAASAEKKAEKRAAAVDDATVTAGVKERLSKSASLKDANINVTTKDGVVTLTGMVKTGGLKGAATNLAKAVAGVKSVNNQLDVELKTPVKKGAAKKESAAKKS